MAGWGTAVDFTDEPKASKLSTFISNLNISRTVHHQIGYHGDSYHEDELILEKWYDYRNWIAELTQNASSTSNLKELNVELSSDCYEWTKHWVYENEAERENYESHHLCLQSINPFWQGVCNGDSGGPLVMIDMVTNEVELVGIVESAIDCTLSPGYYTKVSKYLPWINENLKEFDPRHVMHLIKFDYFHLMINIVIIVIFFGFIFLSFITLYYYTTLPYNHWFRLLIILKSFKIFKIFKAGSARDFVMYLSMNFEELETIIEKLKKEERKLSRREARRGLNYNEEAIKCTYQLHRRTIKYVNDLLWPTHRRFPSCE